MLVLLTIFQMDICRSSSTLIAFGQMEHLSNQHFVEENSSHFKTIAEMEQGVRNDLFNRVEEAILNGNRYAPLNVFAECEQNFMTIEEAIQMIVDHGSSECPKNGSLFVPFLRHPSRIEKNID